MPLMKALRSFRGEVGEGNFAGSERMVEAGGEFTVADDRRAEELERAGHAVPIPQIIQPSPMPEMMSAPPPENKAAHAGPLPSVGGEIGAESAPSSSAPARQPRQRRSRSSGDALDL